MSSSNVITKNTQNVLNILSWLFGVAVFAAGIINTFWGNDPGFGIFLIVVSFIYFPPVNNMIKDWVGFSIPVLIKVLLALFLIMAILGVGELFHKIDLMRKDL